MLYTPLAAAPAAVFVVAALVWFLYRLWLGQESRRAGDWSPPLDGLAWGTVGYAGYLVADRVVSL